MNLLRIYGATLLIALTVGMSACKNDETPATTSTTSEETSNGQKITFDVDIEGLPSDDLRTIIQENIVNGKHAGLKLVWNPGDKETLYLAFKRADAPGSALTVLKSSLTIIKKEGKRYKASVDVNAPVWLNPAKEKVIIAGAIGVSGIDATGGALVPGPRSFYDSGDPYTPPMYFAPTQLHVRTNPGTREREYYADDLTFHFFGSMIGATIDNMQGNMTYSPHEVTLKTGAFTTEGAIQLFDYETDRNNNSVPKWKTAQDAGTTQRVYFEQGDVERGKKHTYYFWAVPAQFSGRREMLMEFRTDAYDPTLGATADEITMKWNVKQLAAGKVHRLPIEIPAPMGDLIITEVFIGGGTYGAATAWEFYNPTDFPINLKDYYIQRFDYHGGYSSSPTFESCLMPDPSLLFYDEAGIESSIDKSSQYNVVRGILPPHKSAVFYTASVVNKNMMPQMRSRDGLVYLFNIASEMFKNGDDRKRLYAEAFYAPRFDVKGQHYRSRHRIVRKYSNKDSKTKGGNCTVETVDAFFWYTNGIRAQYPTATFFRKPGRNLPRKEMQINHNSDWVMRHRYEALDWGYRFSYYFDRDRVKTPALGIHWMEDTSTGSTIPALSTKNGYIYERPIFAPDYSKDDMNFIELKKQAKLYKYVPPMWWTKEHALAADK